ncbi:MAG: TonB-dependent receptor [Gammaproteobacteria bacterium]
MNMYTAIALALAASTTAANAQEPKDSRIEETIIIGHPLSGEGLSQSVEVLQGAELERKVAGNIGATLAKEPGIHTADFGAAVGRPIIHGLGGPRVRIMEDRIDALDVSVTSGDHAVTVEPFIAERIEVLKGPSTLLYGPGAIGGVVDVHTARIPHEVPVEINGGIETRYDSNTQGNSTAFKVNGGGGNWAWHLDGTFKDGDDYDIPGFTESARLRELEEAENEGEEEGEEETQGTLPGSAFDSSSFAAGLSFVGDWGFVGAAVSKIDADYGLPGGHGHEHEGEEEGEEEEEEEGTPLLDMEQTRFDFELGVKNPLPAIESLNVRLGVNDYAHQEIEPDGEQAVEIINKAWELRTELIYNTDLWHGAFGFQHTDRDFSALGEESFAPPVDTSDTGLFWVAERNFDRFSFETGLRVGLVDHSPVEGPDRDFTTFAASAGFVIPVSEQFQIGLNADISSRAPTGEELYSDGVHLVLNSYTLGDQNLDSERAANLSATFQYQSDQWSATATAYYTQFSDFIYQRETGEEREGFPVLLFDQNDATFFGLDTAVSRKVATWNNGDLELRGLLDTVTATLDVSGNDNVPRIPPLRYGVGAEARFGDLSASLDYYRATEQDNVSSEELITDAYHDLRLYVSYDYALPRGTLNLFLAGNNLTDDEQRNHTSFIKEFAPAPGRSFQLGARFSF